jgi:pimeloyl-ACP methyl ester carboxylesterase
VNQVKKMLIHSLNVKSEAYSITDAVVAARAYLTSLNKKTNGQWMTVGHSQGGQAALGAAQYASRASLIIKEQLL